MSSRTDPGIAFDRGWEKARQELFAHLNATLKAAEPLAGIMTRVAPGEDGFPYEAQARYGFYMTVKAALRAKGITGPPHESEEF